MSYRKKLSTQRGFSLIEIILVMAAALLIGIIAFRFYEKVSITSQAEYEARKIQLIQDEIRSSYPRGIYTFPARSVGRTRWSLSNIRLQAASRSNHFEIRIYDIPREYCTAFVKELNKSFESIRIRRGGVGVGGATMINGKGYTELIKNDYIPALNGGTKRKLSGEDHISALCTYDTFADIWVYSS